MFTFNSDSECFTTEASDTRGAHLDQLWDDATDVGFVMVSAKTGKRLPFVFSYSETDREGEVTAWVFNAHTLERPLNRLIARVYND